MASAVAPAAAATTTAPSSASSSSQQQQQGGYYCSTSGTLLEDRAALQEHYKSDFHRYNLKRKVAGLPPVTREWFEARRAQLLSGAAAPSGGALAGPVQGSGSAGAAAPASAAAAAPVPPGHVRVWYDPLLRKTFRTEQTYLAHTRSNKFLEAVRRSGQEAPPAVVSLRKLQDADAGAWRMGGGSGAATRAQPHVAITSGAKGPLATATFSCAASCSRRRGGGRQQGGAAQRAGAGHARLQGGQALGRPAPPLRRGAHTPTTHSPPPPLTATVLAPASPPAMPAACTLRLTGPGRFATRVQEAAAAQQQQQQLQQPRRQEFEHDDDDEEDDEEEGSGWETASDDDVPEEELAAFAAAEQQRQAKASSKQQQQAAAAGSSARKWAGRGDAAAEPQGGAAAAAVEQEEGEEEEEEEWEDWDVRRSLFDTHVSRDLEGNLEYMWLKYGFYLPDAQYLRDPEGLIKYLVRRLVDRVVVV